MRTWLAFAAEFVGTSPCTPVQAAVDRDPDVAVGAEAGTAEAGSWMTAGWDTWLPMLVILAVAIWSAMAWWSERRRANLHAAEVQRFRDVVGTARDVMFTLFPDGRIQTINRAIKGITGQPASSLIGKPFSDLGFSVEDSSLIAAYLERVLQRESSGTAQIRVGTRRNGERVLEVNSHALPVTGPVSVIHGMARDITMRKELERSRLETEQLEAVSRLSGSIAHDFNNILTIIRGNAERLREDGTARPEDVPECLDSILNATRRAELLTLQLSGLSRGQTHRPELLDLHDIILDTARILGRVLPEDISLQHTLAAAPPHIFADRGSIEHILLNLSLNARDAMPNGGTLAFETRRQAFLEGTTIDGLPVRPGDYLVLSIADNGMGMDTDTAGRAFEPFFTTKQPGRGTGLGLATVRSTLTRMGGYIRVSTVPGEGCEFSLYLPWSERRPTPPHRPPRGGDEKILLIEDDPEVLEVLARSLRGSGYDVATACSTEHALDQRASEFDAIVTEVTSTGRTCAEFVAELRSRQPELPVVFMSSMPPRYGTQETLQKTCYLRKPIAAAVLHDELRSLLDTRGDAEPSRSV